MKKSPFTEARIANPGFGYVPETSMLCDRESGHVSISFQSLHICTPRIVLSVQCQRQVDMSVSKRTFFNLTRPSVQRDPRL